MSSEVLLVLLARRGGGAQGKMTFKVKSYEQIRIAAWDGIETVAGICAGLAIASIDPAVIVIKARQ